MTQRKRSSDAKAKRPQKELRVPGVPARPSQGEKAPAPMSPAKQPAKQKRRSSDVETWRDLIAPGPLFSLAKIVAAVVTVFLTVSGAFSRLDGVESAVQGVRHSLIKTQATIDDNHDAAAVKFRSIQQESHQIKERLDCVAAHRQRTRDTCF